MGLVTKSSRLGMERTQYFGGSGLDGDLKGLCDLWNDMGAAGNPSLEARKKWAGGIHMHLCINLGKADSLKELRKGKGSYGAIGLEEVSF